LDLKKTSKEGLDFVSLPQIVNEHDSAYGNNLLERKGVQPFRVYKKLSAPKVKKENPKLRRERIRGSVDNLSSKVQITGNKRHQPASKQPQTNLALHQQKQHAVQQHSLNSFNQQHSPAKLPIQITRSIQVAPQTQAKL